MEGKYGDGIYCFDYCKDGKGKGDHHNFYGNERYINIFCNICRGDMTFFSKYDLEVIAEMIRKEYVIKEENFYHALIPVYTISQYGTVTDVVKEFISTGLFAIIKEMDMTATHILSSHTPKHLQNQVTGIAAMDKFVNAVCIPAAILINEKDLTLHGIRLKCRQLMWF